MSHDKESEDIPERLYFGVELVGKEEVARFLDEKRRRHLPVNRSNGTLGRQLVLERLEQAEPATVNA